MSALCRPYPDRVKVDGKTWELNLSLKNVLMAMEVPDAEGLLPTDAASNPDACSAAVIWATSPPLTQISSSMTITSKP